MTDTDFLKVVVKFLRMQWTNEACVAGFEEKKMRMITIRTINTRGSIILNTVAAQPGNNELLTLLVIFL